MCMQELLSMCCFLYIKDCYMTWSGQQYVGSSQSCSPCSLCAAVFNLVSPSTRPYQHASCPYIGLFDAYMFLLYIYIEIIRNQCSNTPCCHESDRPHQTKSQAPLARCPGQGDAVSSTYNGLLSQNWYGPKAWIQFTQTTGDDSWTNFETLLWGGWQCGGSPCPLHLQDWIHPLCTLPVL